MARIHRWRDEPFHVYFEASYCPENDHWYAEDDLHRIAKHGHRVMPAWFGEYADTDEVAEVVIEGRSSGYYDPGRTYGDPDDCYAPEGEDERELYSLTIDGQDIPEDRALEIVALFASEFQSADHD